jgi:hypothetical protein
MDISKIRSNINDKMGDLKDQLSKNTVLSNFIPKNKDVDDEADAEKDIDSDEKEITTYDDAEDADEDEDADTEDADTEDEDADTEDEDADTEDEDEDADEDTGEDDDTDINWGKLIYKNSISIIIILIIFLLTSNVLSLSYINKKTANRSTTFIDDVQKIIFNSSSLYTNNIKNIISDSYYKDLLSWYKNDSFYGSTLYKFINVTFPPLIIVVYIIIFFILQIYTFFKGFVYSIENIFALKIKEFIMTMLYLSFLPVLYFLINKYLISSSGSSNVSFLKVLFHAIVFPIFFILFSTVPFTGLTSFYIFSLIFFNSYNKLNKLFFIISKLKFLFFIYLLISFFSISLAEINIKTINIISGVGLGISLLVLLLIVAANAYKVMNPNSSFYKKVLKYFTSIIEFESTL